MSREKLKVLMLPGWWPNQDSPSLGVFIREQIHAIAIYCDVYVLFIEYKNGLMFGYKLRSERCSNYTIYRLTISSPFFGLGIGSILTKFVVYKLKLKGKIETTFDIKHLHIFDWKTINLNIISGFSSKKTVLTEHSSFYHHKTDLKKASYLRKSYHKKPLDSIVCVSHDLKKALASFFDVSKSEITVIPNVASEEFVYNKSAKPKAGSAVKLLLCAKWVAPKNPILFLEALIIYILKNHDQKIEVNILGSGEQLKSMESFVTKNNLDKIVTFHGHVSKKSFANWLSKSNIFVHPSDSENLPTVIIESLSCGVPVLSMNINGIPEMISESNGILVPPKDKEALAAGLEKMIKKLPSFDNEQIAKLANSKYSVQAIGQSYLMLYQSMLS